MSLSETYHFGTLLFILISCCCFQFLSKNWIKCEIIRRSFMTIFSAPMAQGMEFFSLHRFFGFLLGLQQALLPGGRAELLHQAAFAPDLRVAVGVA